jgi:hypothetical protein
MKTRRCGTRHVCPTCIPSTPPSAHPTVSCILAIMPLVGFHPQTRQPQVTQVTFPTVIWQVVFKDVRDDIVFLSNEPWHTRIKPLCSPHGTHYAASGHASPSPPAPPLSSHYRVSVLRDMPPVLLVHDFATEEECEWLVNETLPRMKPSLIVR